MRLKENLKRAKNINMKKLTEKEFTKAPRLIQFAYMLSSENIPVSSKILGECMEKYPEYFPYEIEAKRKWAAVPQKVHDDYWEQRKILEAETFKDMPPSMGLIGWANNPGAFENWRKEYEKRQSELKPKIRALHENFYKKYGIEYNGF